MTSSLLLGNNALAGGGGGGGGGESPASTTVAGIAEIATTAEVNTGTDNTRIVSPAALAATTTVARITSGAGAPGSTPTKVGDLYVDTTADELYVATGTASAADWRLYARVGYVDDEIVALPSVEDAAAPHDEIYWDDTTVPGALLARLRSTPRELGILAGAGLGVTSTSSETTLLTGTLTPPAGSVETSSWMQWVAWGSAIQSSGSDQTFRWRIKVGSSAILDTGAITLPSSASGRLWQIHLRMRLTGASGGTLTQGMAQVLVGAPLAGANDTYSRLISATPLVVNPASWPAIDLTIQHGSSASSSTTIANCMMVSRHKP